MLIGRVCKFYGWEFEYVWKMPATRFFAFHRAMDKLEALDLLEQTDIAAVSICNEKYVAGLKQRFAANFEHADAGNPKETEQKKVREAMDDAAGTEMLMDLLADYKKVNFGR